MVMLSSWFHTCCQGCSLVRWHLPAGRLCSAAALAHLSGFKLQCGLRANIALSGLYFIGGSVRDWEGSNALASCCIVLFCFTGLCLRWWPLHGLMGVHVYCVNLVTAAVGPTVQYDKLI